MNSTAGPSKIIGPKFEELSKLEENAGVVFAQLDIDDVADVTADEEVRFVPTFKFYKNGEEVAEVMGLGADLATITALLAEHK